VEDEVGEVISIRLSLINFKLSLLIFHYAIKILYNIILERIKISTTKQYKNKDNFNKTEIEMRLIKTT
jgi:hypothetical protein